MLVSHGIFSAVYILLLTSAIISAHSRWCDRGYVETKDARPDLYSNDNNLRLSSFNLKIFGRSKIRKRDAIKIFVKIIRRYDIVAVQEIRDAKQTAFPYLLEQVNKMDPSTPYKMVVSTRLGRTSSKEQYGFLYNTAKVSVKDTYQYEDGPDDGSDAFEREPYAVRFSVPTAEVDDFAIINVHIKPDDAVAEIDKLPEVYDKVKAHWNLENIIIAGDFNADCNYVGADDFKSISLRTDPRFHWLTTDCTDTTSGRTDCAYDRFVAAGKALVDSVVPGSAGVFNFQKAYGLSYYQTMRVSDHYPIFIELSGKKISGVQTNLQTYWSFKVVEKNYVTNVNNLRAIYRSELESFSTTGFKIGTSYFEVLASKTGIRNVIKSLKKFRTAYPGVLSDNMLRMVQAHMNTPTMSGKPPYVYGLDDSPRVTYGLAIRCRLKAPMDCSVTVERRTH